MSSILEIFFPLCASDTIRWQRRTPDVEHGIWPDVADERLQQWLQTTIRSTLHSRRIDQRLAG